MAATTLTYVQPGYIERHGVGADALDKTIDALVKRHNQTLLQGSRFFRTEMPRGGTYKESGYGDDMPLPPTSEDSDLMPFATPTPDFNVSISVVNKRLAVAIERSMIEDELQPVAVQMASGLMRVGKLLLEYGFADVINNATTAANTGGDGVPLADNSHPHPRRQTGTWDNLETAAALTTSSFTTARTNMRKRQDTRGYINSLKPTMLVGPPDLERKMRELKDAEKVPENSLNQPWVFKNDDWGWFVWDYMTSTTAWFMVGDVPPEKRGLIYVQRVAPSIAPLEGSDKSTDIIMGERLRMRVGFGFRVAHEIQYNAGL